MDDWNYIPEDWTEDDLPPVYDKSGGWSIEDLIDHLVLLAVYQNGNYQPDIGFLKRRDGEVYFASEGWRIPVEDVVAWKPIELPERR